MDALTLNLPLTLSPARRRFEKAAGQVLHAGAARRGQRKQKAKKFCLPFRHNRSVPLSDLKVLPPPRLAKLAGVSLRQGHGTASACSLTCRVC